MSSHNHSQRGRPPKKADEKRIQVNVRLLTADREKLQTLADESEKPVATEAENILAKYLARRNETNDLLDRIAVQIEQLEEKAHGKWHKNLMAWAAVAEMLSRALDDYRPERIYDDEIVVGVREQMKAKQLSRLALVSLVSDRGISVKIDPRPDTLLGTHTLQRGILRTASHSPDSTRLWEQAAINAMPEDDAKQEVQFFFNALCKLDDEIADLEEEEAKAMLPYIEAEQLGRRIATPAGSLSQMLYTAEASLAESTVIKNMMGSKKEES